MKDVLHTFLDFEKEILNQDTQYKGLSIWPMLRTIVFEELVNEVNDLNGLPRNTHKRKITFSIFLSRILLLFNEVFSLVHLTRKVDILIITNEGKNQVIENKKTNKLLWAFSKALNKEYSLLAVNTQISDISESGVYSIKFSTVLSLLARLRALFPSGDKWKKVERSLGEHISDYYSVQLNWNSLYVNGYCRQVSLSKFVQLIIFLKSPKLILFSDNGAMGAVNRIAKLNKTKTMDYQHAITTDFHVVYSHNKSIDKDYRQYLSDYFFSWGSYNLDKFREFYNCKVGGNAFFELEKELVKNVTERLNTILIISDDQLTRTTLENLAKYLCKTFPDHTIYYKLRPEEYGNWRDTYSKDLSRIDNIEIIDNDSKSLYYYLKKSQFVIGTSSSVLVEAVSFSKVIVFEGGWSWVMNQYIEDNILLSATSHKGVAQIIRDNPDNASKNIEKSLFAEDSLQLTKNIIDEICNT